jgi:parallel beta-helix repeat protein
VAAFETFANNPSTTVSSGGTTAPSPGTTETWTVASSSSFPAAATGTSQFHVGDPVLPTEVIAVTNVSGTTWTVTRGAEGTTPVARAAGFTVQQVVTAGPLGTFTQAGRGDIGGTGAAPTVTATHLASPLPIAQGGTAAGTQQAALNALAGTQTLGYVLGSDGTNVKMVPDAGATWKVPAPTGVTATDTPAVAAAIAKLTTAGGNGTLLFQDGTYQVDSNALVIRNCANFAVKGTGAAFITQAPNRAGAANNTTGNLFTIADCTDFRVEGITFDGLRDTVAPLTPLSASASSGQPSVTVAAGNGARYVTGQGLALFGGLGSGEQAQSDGWGGGGGATPLIISSITPGGGTGGGDLITFTTNLGHTYASISSTVSSDGFGPYACAGAYLTPYQVGHSNSVAGRTLGGEDQQNGLHLISCQRFTVTRVTARNLWESGIKLGTGFASTALTDGCSQGAVTDCTAYHGYDQGVSVWLSQNVTVKGCVISAAGWAGISLTASDYCTVTANQVAGSVYRVPASLTQGHGIAIEGGRGNLVKGNSISSPYNTGINCHQSPLAWGLAATYPSLGAFVEEGAAAGTSIQVSTSGAFQVGGLYSILDGAQTEAVAVASIVDGTHVTLADSLRFSHPSGVFFWNRVAQDNVIEGNRVSATQTGPGIGGSVQVRSVIKGNSAANCALQAVTVGFTTSNLPAGTFLAGNGSAIEGNTAAQVSGTVILAAGSSDLLIAGNIASGSATSFVQGIDVSGCTDTVVSGNHVSDIAGARGIYGNTGGPSSTPCARVTVIGNTVRRCATEGILFFNADSLTITGNTVSSCGGDGGINLRGVSSSVISGNICNSNGTAGIDLEDNSGVFCLNNRVTGNTARDDGTGINVQTGAALSQKHGIHETGSSNFNLYTGNECDANATDQLVTIGASSYAWANVISGAVTGNVPAALLPSATTSVQGAVVLDGTAGDIQNTGPQAAGNSTKAAAANHVHFSSGQYLCTPTQYAPASVTTLTQTGAALAAISSTNINTGSFAAPASGSVLVTASFVAQISASGGPFAAGLLAHGGSTLYGMTVTVQDNAANVRRPYCLQFLVTGLTPGTSYNFDLAAAANANTFTLYAYGETATSPNLGNFGAPAVMTVQAV